MTKKERDRMMDDPWPEYTEQERQDLIKAVKKASKLRIFDFEDDENRNCKCPHTH